MIAPTVRSNMRNVRSVLNKSEKINIAQSVNTLEYNSALYCE